MAFWVFAALLVIESGKRSRPRCRDHSERQDPAEKRITGRRAYCATAAVLALAAGGIAFDLIGGDPLAADTATIRTAPPAELCGLAFDRAETRRADWLYAGWIVFLVGLTMILAGRQPTTRPARPRTWLLLALALTAAALGISALGLRPSRADILNRAGLRWRTDLPQLRGQSSSDVSAILFTAVALHKRAVAAALLIPPDAGAQASTPVPPHARCDVMQSGREELFASAVATLEAARPWHPASPLIPLNLTFVQARWARGSADPDERARHGSEADAWLDRAREMYPPGLPLERWLTEHSAK